MSADSPKKPPPKFIPPRPKVSALDTGDQSAPLQAKPDDLGEANPPPSASPLSPLSDDAAVSPSQVTPADPEEEVGEDDVFIPAPRSNPVVDALKREGLYRAKGEMGRHHISCAWSGEHDPAMQYVAEYIEPDTFNPVGQFLCSSPHRPKRDASMLVHKLGISPTAARAKRRIRVKRGDLHLAAAAAEFVLAEDGSFFHAGGPIVRIIAHGEHGTASAPVNEATLTTYLAGKVDWEELGRNNRWERCDPPPRVIQALFKAQDRPHLNALGGIARQPFLTPEHQLVTTPGFNAQTGIFGAFDPAAYDFEDLSRGNAEFHLRHLDWMLREFPFKTPPDQSAALCLWLTAAVRTSLPQAPGFSITASRSGSGKSYLASTATLFAGPGEPHSISYPTTTEEASKVALAVLMEKPPAVLFDDMQGDWTPFGPLNRVLTSPTTTERVLGFNRTATARTNVLILGTGNNIEPVGDMRRRIVSIRLEPKAENPALRRYDKHGPVEHIRKCRADPVLSALTIIAAYLAAGAPEADVKPIGTYGVWSKLCRQPLIWLGLPDPATSLIDQVSNDTDRQFLADLIQVWLKHFGYQSVTVRKLIATAKVQSDLMDVLLDLPIGDNAGINPGKLGWFLKKNRGRRVEGLWIEAGESSERNAWRITGS